MNDNQRQKLKPFILRIVGNRDPKSEQERLRFIILETARRVVPINFDKKWSHLAKEAREISDDADFKEIERIMNKLKSAAANAAAYAANAAAANAAAYAAAAYASDAAANAAAAYAANAYASDAAAADAAAYAANAAANAAWKESIWILDNVLKIGKQSPEFDETKVRKAINEFELASTGAI